MSLEHAKKFIQKLKTDEEFTKKIHEAKDKTEKFNLAKEAGFIFTIEELHLAKGELSEKDLNEIEGGNSEIQMIKLQQSLSVYNNSLITSSNMISKINTSILDIISHMTS